MMLWQVNGVANEITLDFSTNQVMLGKPIGTTMTVVLPALTAPSDPTLSLPEFVDFLKPLQQHFRVLELEKELLRNGTQQIHKWKLSLYPYRIGKLTVPKLVWVDAQGVAHLASVNYNTLNIEQTANPTNITFLEPDTKDIQLWQREQLVLRYSVISSDKYISLKWDRPNSAGYVFHKIAHTKEPTVYNGKNSIRHDVGLILFPLEEGEMELKLPPVVYQQGGRDEYLFYPLPVVLRVQKLPVYVNPSVPVIRKGKLNANYELGDRLFYQPEEIVSLSIQLTAFGVPAQWLPPLFNHMQERLRSDIRLYEPNIREQNQLDIFGLQGSRHYTLNFSSDGMGFYQLPKLDLNYFDAASGELAGTRVDSVTIFVLNSITLVVSSILLGCVFLVFSFKFVVVLLHARSTRKEYRLLIDKARRQLEQAHSLIEVRTAMRTYADAHHWPKNLTLLQWQQYAIDKAKDKSVFYTAMSALQRMQYGADDIHSEQLHWLKSVIFPDSMTG